MRGCWWCRRRANAADRLLYPRISVMAARRAVTHHVHILSMNRASYRLEQSSRRRRLVERAAQSHGGTASLQRLARSRNRKIQTSREADIIRARSRPYYICFPSCRWPDFTPPRRLGILPQSAYVELTDLMNQSNGHC